MPAPARVADVTEFFTYQHPGDYHADWAGYYRDAMEGRREVASRFPHDLALRYGEHPNHLVNVYRPRGFVDGAPLILYFHGGRWREGHPDFYDQLALPWVEDGAVFASCGYRLEPEGTIADAVDDCVRVIEWARHSAKAFGASPDRLVVAGHSAGGHLSAMATLTDWAGTDHPLHDAVAATLCMSTPSDLRVFGAEDDGEAARLSPVRHISRSPARVVVSYGDPEPNKKSSPDTELTEHGRALARALEEFGRPATVVEMPDTDHVGTATAFSDRDSALHAAAHDAVFAGDDGTHLVD